MGRDYIFKPTVGNESLQQDSNDNGVRIVKFATSKNLVFNSTMQRTETYINTPNGKTQTELVASRWLSSILNVRSLMGVDFDTDYCMVFAEVRVRLAVSKKGSQKLDVSRCNLRKLSEAGG